MPQPLPTIYTGRNAVSAPSDRGLTEQSIQSGLRELKQTYEKRRAEKRADEEAFLESISLDPIAVSAENVLKDQSDMIDGFNNKWSDVYSQRKGRLTMEDKAKMRADKLAIQAWQTRKLGAHQEMLEAQQMVARYPDRYDPVYFGEAMGQYIKTGDRPQGGFLDVAPMELGEYEKSIELGALGGRTSIKDSSRWEYTAAPTASGVTDETWTPTWSEEEARGWHYQNALSDTSKLKLITREWEGLTEDKKLSVMDVVDENNNGKIDPGEERNAILEYDFQKYRDRYLKPRSRPRGQSYSATRDMQSTPQSAINQVLTRGGGMGYTAGTRFDYSGDGVVSSYIGGGAGIVFDYSGLSSQNKGWIEVPSEKFIDLPENAQAAPGTVLKARPRVNRDGMVEWTVQMPVVKSASLAELNMASAAEKKKYTKLDNGKWIYTDIQEQPATTNFNATYGLIDAAYPGFSELSVRKGMDKGGKEVKGIKGSIFD